VTGENSAEVSAITDHGGEVADSDPLEQSQVRERYTVVEYLWMPALAGVSVTALAIYKFGVVADFARDSGVPVWSVLGLFFVLGCAAALPLMLCDSIERDWLRNLVLGLGMLAIVTVVIAFSLILAG
jgi:hypothetical protein